MTPRYDFQITPPDDYKIAFAKAIVYLGLFMQYSHIALFCMLFLVYGRGAKRARSCEIRSKAARDSVAVFGAI
jgi:hypothetical protein